VTPRSFVAAYPVEAGSDLCPARASGESPKGRAGDPPLGLRPRLNRRIEKKAAPVLRRDAVASFLGSASREPIVQVNTRLTLRPPGPVPK
jgi:hypothetical protein